MDLCLMKIEQNVGDSILHIQLRECISSYFPLYRTDHAQMTQYDDLRLTGDAMKLFTHERNAHMNASEPNSPTAHTLTAQLHLMQHSIFMKRSAASLHTRPLSACSTLCNRMRVQQVQQLFAASPENLQQCHDSAAEKERSREQPHTAEQPPVNKHSGEGHIQATSLSCTLNQSRASLYLMLNCV